jgi:hypothetical protein
MLLSLKWAVFMCIIKKEYQLDHYCLAITRQRSCCITYFVDFTYYKTDITALNAIIKYSLGWATFTSIAVLFKKTYEFLPETFW